MLCGLFARRWLLPWSLGIATTVLTAGADAQGIPFDSLGIPAIDLAEVAAKLPVVPPDLAAYLQRDPEAAERLRQLQADEYNRNKAEALRRARAHRAPAPRAPSSTSSTTPAATAQAPTKTAAGQ